MPITAGEAPQAVDQLVDRELASLRAATASPGASLAESGGAAPVKHQPLPVYHISLAKLGPNSVAADATRIGWRYFVGGEGSDSLRTVDVRDAEGRAQVTAITRGGAVATLSAASAAAERATTGAAGQHYEARILEFGRAGPGALWLHAATGSPDRFFSLDAEPRERTEGDVIGEAARSAAIRRRGEEASGAIRTPGMLSNNESGG